VTRGWLGVLVQKVTPEIAESLGLKDATGALVADVVKEGPPRKPASNVGDVIVEFNGAPVKDSVDFAAARGGTPVGQGHQIEVLRGSARSCSTSRSNNSEGRRGRGGLTQVTRRISVSACRSHPQIAESLGLDASATAWSSLRWTPAAPQTRRRIRRGDVILEINRKAVKDNRVVHAALKATDSARPAPPRPSRDSTISGAQAREN